MTVNELVGKIELRIKELGKLPTKELIYEHPELREGDAMGFKIGYGRACKMMTGKGREGIIAEIIAEEFSLEYDLEIES